MNLVQVLDATVRRRPDHPALVWGDAKLTYRELQEASKKAATVLREAGVSKGDRVMLLTLNDPGFVVALYGAWRLGAVVVPTNHKLVGAELVHIVSHSGAKVGVVSDALLENAQNAAPDVRWMPTNWEGAEFEQLVSAAEPLDTVDCDETDVAEILYTSGTTSAPKGCVHSHQGLVALAPAVASTIMYSRHERFLMAMPIWHASPLNNWFLTSVYVGGTTVLLREYDPIKFIELMESEKITATFGAPIAFAAPVQVLAAHGRALSEFDLSSVEKLIYGAAPMGAEMVQKLMQAYGTQNFYQVYGMTETGPAGACLIPEDQVEKAGSIGRGGMFSVDLMVVDDNDQEITADGVGEIWMRTKSSMSHYLNNDEATEEAFHDGWYKTGDVGRVDEDGYIYVVDRKKDVIITGGENVFSAEVEEALRTHSKVRDVAVVGKPHESWGETVVAVIVCDDGDEVTVEEVKGHLDDKIAKYKIPREIVMVKELPRNPSGKIMKHKVREQVTT